MHVAFAVLVIGALFAFHGMIFSAVMIMDCIMRMLIVVLVCFERTSLSDGQQDDARCRRQFHNVGTS